MTNGSQITLKLMHAMNSSNGYVLYQIIIYKEYLNNGLLLKHLENGLLVYQESFSMTLVEKR